MKFNTRAKTQVLISPVIDLTGIPPGTEEIVQGTVYLVDRHGDGKLYAGDSLLGRIDYCQGNVSLTETLRDQLEMAGFEEYNVQVTLPFPVVDG